MILLLVKSSLPLLNFETIVDNQLFLLRITINVTICFVYVQSLHKNTPKVKVNDVKTFVNNICSHEALCAVRQYGADT